MLPMHHIIDDYGLLASEFFAFCCIILLFRSKYLYGVFLVKGNLPNGPSAPISCWNAPKLWDGLKGLEQVGDAPQTAREPRRHAAQDVLRLLFRV